MRVFPRNAVMRLGSSIACLVLGASVAVAAPGDFDPTFDGDGIVENDYGSKASARDVAIQPDGKIVVAGASQVSGTPRLTVARFEVDGSPDPGFGMAGVATASAGFFSEASAVALAPDGKIVIAGNVNLMMIAIARFDAMGVLDPTFGDAGVTITDLPGEFDTAEGLVVLPDGKLVVGGYAHDGDAWHGILVAYDDAGDLVDSFGDAGIVVSEEPGSLIFALTFNGASIVAGGTGNGGQPMLARYKTNGALAAITHAPATHPFDPYHYGAWNDVAVDPGGRVIVAGRFGSFRGTAVARFDKNGQLDADFGTDGLVTVHLDPTANDEEAVSLAVQPDGRILVATRSMRNLPSIYPRIEYRWWLARFDAAGVVDTAFAGDGSLSILEARPESLALQPDGKVVTAGTRVETPPPAGIHDPPPPSPHTWLLVTRNEAVDIACTATARTDCATPVAPGASSLTLRAAGKPKLVWKWKKGTAALGDFGDPTMVGPYAFCFYDATTALVAGGEIQGGGTCAGRPCWSPTGSSGWRFKDPSRTQWGVAQLKLKAGNGSAQIALKGQGSNLPQVPLPSALPIRVQLQAPTGQCFAATFSTARPNEATKLNAKSD